LQLNEQSDVCCGLVEAKIRASDKDLPVNKNIPVKNDQYIQGTS